MIKGNNILIVVPARGGSKGIRLKNLKKLNGKPLVTLVGEIVSQLGFVDRAIVSTDHQKIAEVAGTVGLEVPFMRPKELSGDIISDVDVLTHALLEMEKIDNCKYEIIVMLQPTSPFRKAEHVIQTVEKLIEGKFDSVLTISETDSKAHPLKQLTLDAGRVKYYDDNGKKIIARQQLEPVYHRNGVAYAMTRECLLTQRSTIGDNASAIIINQFMPNIDTNDDLVFADYLISNELNN